MTRTRFTKLRNAKQTYNLCIEGVGNFIEADLRDGSNRVIAWLYKANLPGAFEALEAEAQAVIDAEQFPPRIPVRH